MIVYLKSLENTFSKVYFWMSATAPTDIQGFHIATLSSLSWVGVGNCLQLGCSYSIQIGNITHRGVVFVKIEDTGKTKSVGKGTTGYGSHIICFFILDIMDCQNTLLDIKISKKIILLAVLISSQERVLFLKPRKLFAN